MVSWNGSFWLFLQDKSCTLSALDLLQKQVLQTMAGLRNKNSVLLQVLVFPVSLN